MDEMQEVKPFYVRMDELQRENLRLKQENKSLILTNGEQDVEIASLRRELLNILADPSATCDIQVRAMKALDAREAGERRERQGELMSVELEKRS